MRSLVMAAIAAFTFASVGCAGTTGNGWTQGQGATPPANPTNNTPAPHAAAPTITVSKAEFDRKTGSLPGGGHPMRSRAFCKTFGPEEWNLIFPDIPSEYGGTVCYRH